MGPLNTIPEWLTTLIAVGFGIVLTYFFNRRLELLRHKHTDAKVRESILGEIMANVEAASKGDWSSLLWVDDVYKANLDKIGCFPIEQLQKIVRFYAKVAQYRDRITRGYEEHLKHRKQTEKLGIKGQPGIFEGTVELLAKEIKQLGQEILADQWHDVWHR